MKQAAVIRFPGGSRQKGVEQLRLDAGGSGRSHGLRNRRLADTVAHEQAGSPKTLADHRHEH